MSLRWLFSLATLTGICLLGATPARADIGDFPVLEGTISRIYPPGGRAAVMVSFLRLPGGIEVHLPEPRPAAILLGASGRPLLPNGSLVRRVEDLRPGDSVRLAVSPDAERRLVSLDVLNRAIPPVPRTAAEQNHAFSGWYIRPLWFPVIGSVAWTQAFGHNRYDGMGPHKGVDLEAGKMTPIVAAFPGTVYLINRPNSNYLTITSRDGWTAVYIHLNNDTPGTNDNCGSCRYAFAAGLRSGDHVAGGQLLGYVGNSGYTTGPHLHFELHRPDGVINPAASLKRAARLSAPRLAKMYPEVRPKRGEVRLDGFVKALNREKGKVELAVRARWDSRGYRTILSRPQYVWVKVDSGMSVAGAYNVPVDMDQLAYGTPLTVVGAVTRKATALGQRGRPCRHDGRPRGDDGQEALLNARRVLVEAPTFLPDPDVSALLESNPPPAPAIHQVSARTNAGGSPCACGADAK